MSEKNQSRAMSDAERRMGNDDATMQVVDPNRISNAGVRFSDEALDILRLEGTDAYERYIKEHTS